MASKDNLSFFQRWWPSKGKPHETVTPEILPKTSLESKPSPDDPGTAPGPSKPDIDKTPVTATSSSDSSSFSGSSTARVKPTFLSRLWTPLWKPFKKNSQTATAKPPDSDEISSSQSTPTSEVTPRRPLSTHEESLTVAIKAISPRPTNATLTGAITDTANALARRALTVPAIGRGYMHKPHCPLRKTLGAPPTSADAMHPSHHQRHLSETGSSSVDSSVDSIYEGITGRAASVRSLNLGSPDRRSLKAREIRPRQPYRPRSWANMRPKNPLREIRDSFTGHGDGEYRRHIQNLLIKLEQADAEKKERVEKSPKMRSEDSDGLDTDKSSDEEVVKVDKGKGRAVDPLEEVLVEDFGQTRVEYNGSGRVKLERRRSSRSEA